MGAFYSVTVEIEEGQPINLMKEPFENPEEQFENPVIQTEDLDDLMRQLLSD
jgi:hypothetical protein